MLTVLKMGNSTGITNDIFNITQNEYLSLRRCRLRDVLSGQKEGFFHVNQKNITMVKIIANSMGVYYLDPIFAILENNQSMCDPPASVTIGILCSVAPMFLKSVDSASTIIYGKDGDIDMSNSTMVRTMNALTSYEKRFKHSGVETSEGDTAKAFPRSIENLKKLQEAYASRHKSIDFFVGSIKEKLSGVTGESALKYIISEDSIDYAESMKRSNVWNTLHNNIRIFGIIKNKLPKLISDVLENVTYHVPRIFKYYKAAINHYTDLNGVDHDDHGKLSHSEQYKAKKNLFSKYPFSKTAVSDYYLYGEDFHHKGKKKHAGNDVDYWTGWGSSASDEDLNILSIQMIRFVGCGFCWGFRWTGLDCCNDNGCNLGFPIPTVPDPILCRYPHFIVDSTWLDNIFGMFDPSNPMCDDYSSWIGYTHGVIWYILTAPVSMWVTTHPNILNWFFFGTVVKWFYYNISGAIPPNLGWCLAINFRVGVLTFLVIGGVVFLVSIIFDILIAIQIYVLARRNQEVILPTVDQLATRGIEQANISAGHIGEFFLDIGREITELYHETYTKEKVNLKQE